MATYTDSRGSMPDRARRARRRLLRRLLLTALSAGLATGCGDASGPPEAPTYRLVAVDGAPVPASVTAGSVTRTFTSGGATFVGDTLRMVARFTDGAATDSTTLRVRYTAAGGRLTLWWPTGPEDDVGTLDAHEASVRLLLGFAPPASGDSAVFIHIAYVEFDFQR